MSKILFMYIFYYIISVNYLSFYNIKTDDCIDKMFITNDLVSYSTNQNQEVSNNGTGVYELDDKINDCKIANHENKYLAKYFGYSYGSYLNIQIHDVEHFDSFFCFKFYFNEYIITSETSYTDLFTCYDCIGNGDKNYRMGTNCYNCYFESKNNNDGYHYYYFHFTFKVDSLEKIKLQGFEVNEEFYSFNTQQYFNYYFHVNHIPD